MSEHLKPPVEDAAGLWYVGVTMSIVASILSNLGVNVQKYSMMQESALPRPAQRPYISQPLWWSGLALVVLGSIGDFAALGFAAQSLITPVGGVTMVANVFFAHFWLKESLSKTDVAGTAAIVCGVALIATFADKRGSNYTLDELMELYAASEFLVYGALVVTSSMALYILSKYVERVRIRGGPSGVVSKEYLWWRPIHQFIYPTLSGVLGAQSVLFAKSTAELIKSTFNGENQFNQAPAFLIVMAMFSTIFMQLHWLAVGLKFFDAVIVIPLFQMWFILVTIFGGAVAFGEFSAFTPAQAIMFPVGVLVVLAGIVALSTRRAGPERTPRFLWRVSFLAVMFMVRVRRIVRLRRADQLRSSSGRHASFDAADGRRSGTPTRERSASDAYTPSHERELSHSPAGVALRRRKEAGAEAAAVPRVGRGARVPGLPPLLPTGARLAAAAAHGTPEGARATGLPHSAPIMHSNSFDAATLRARDRVEALIADVEGLEGKSTGMQTPATTGAAGGPRFVGGWQQVPTADTPDAAVAIRMGITQRVPLSARGRSRTADDAEELAFPQWTVATEHLLVPPPSGVVVGVALSNLAGLLRTSTVGVWEGSVSGLGALGSLGSAALTQLGRARASIGRSLTAGVADEVGSLEGVGDEDDGYGARDGGGEADAAKGGQGARRGEGEGKGNRGSGGSESLAGIVTGGAGGSGARHGADDGGEGSGGGGDARRASPVVASAAAGVGGTPQGSGGGRYSPGEEHAASPSVHVMPLDGRADARAARLVVGDEDAEAAAPAAAAPGPAGPALPSADEAETGTAASLSPSPHAVPSAAHDDE